MGRRLEENMKGDKSLIYGLADGYRAKDKKVVNSNIKDVNGNILIGDKEINDEWTKYFKGLLNVEQVEDEDIRVNEEELFEIVKDDRTFTMDEFKEALLKMKTGKSPGVDGIGIELIKEAGVETMSCLLKIINNCWVTGSIPNEWGKTIIVPFFKGKGDPFLCSNYRGISLNLHVVKLYERMLEKRIRDKIEVYLSEEQHGYRKNRGTTDLIFSLRQVYEKSLEFNLNTHVAFIDLQKAFDSVPRKKLWNCLRVNYGITSRLNTAVKSLYEPSLNKVRTNYENCEWFEVDTGVKQGSVLSPLLFIMYLNVVILSFKEKWLRIDDGGILAYADDIAFWSVNEAEFVRGLILWDECFREYGLKMNTEKTVIMNIGRNREENLNVVINNQMLKNVDNFTYLGSVFTSKNSIGMDITKRIKTYSKEAGRLYPILKEDSVPMNVKKLIFETILTPTLMYGSECWHQNVRNRSRIQAAEMKTLRCILGVNRLDKIRNTRIRDIIEVHPILRKIELGQLRWLGHMERMDQNRVARRYREWLPQGRRPLGRPYKRWKDGIKETLEQLHLPDLEHLRANNTFRDRHAWRRMAQLTGV
jgi:hypothetical protein